jgi:dihydrodipicolinate synthase/N-acetylneuraminate lyase
MVGGLREAIDKIPAGPAKIFNCHWNAGPVLFYMRPDLLFVDVAGPFYLMSARPDLSNSRDILISGQSLNPYAEIKNYFSVKEASGNLDQIREVINRVPKNFMVYSGDDGLTLDVLKMGGFGVVSVASHLVGKQIKQMICLAKAGKIAEAEVLNQKLQDVFKVLFIISNPSPLKAAMNLIGFKAGGVRLPLVMPNATELAQIKKALDALALTV